MSGVLGLRRASVTYLLHSSCTGWSQGAKIVFGACIVMQSEMPDPGMETARQRLAAGPICMALVWMIDSLNGVSLTAEAGGECP